MSLFNNFHSKNLVLFCAQKFFSLKCIQNFTKIFTHDFHTKYFLMIFTQEFDMSFFQNILSYYSKYFDYTDLHSIHFETILYSVCCLTIFTQTLVTMKYFAHDFQSKHLIYTKSSIFVCDIHLKCSKNFHSKYFLIFPTQNIVFRFSIQITSLWFSLRICCRVFTGKWVIHSNISSKFSAQYIFRRFSLKIFSRDFQSLNIFQSY